MFLRVAPASQGVAARPCDRPLGLFRPRGRPGPKSAGLAGAPLALCRLVSRANSGPLRPLRVPAKQLSDVGCDGAGCHIWGCAPPRTVHTDSGSYLIPGLGQPSDSPRAAESNNLPLRGLLNLECQASQGSPALQPAPCRRAPPMGAWRREGTAVDLGRGRSGGETRVAYVRMGGSLGQGVASFKS